MNRSELIKRIKDNHAAFIQFIGSLSDEQLRISKPNKWNAYQQAEHIYLCLRPIQLALRLPNWFPRLMFGKSKSGSRSYELLVSAYRSKLQAGGKAPSSYVPKRHEGSIHNLLAKLESLVDQVCRQIEHYEESQLDTIRLPHPLLGKLTIRELLFFSIYHVGHHHQQVSDQL
jgi:hypothetical protein